MRSDHERMRKRLHLLGINAIFTSIDDEGIVDFIGIAKGMGLLDVGGVDRYYSKKFAARGADVTIIDAYDDNFEELNSMGIKTILQDFCGYDIVFVADVYRDLVHSCRTRTLEILAKISPKYTGNLDLTKEDLGTLHRRFAWTGTSFSGKVCPLSRVHSNILKAQ